MRPARTALVGGDLDTYRRIAYGVINCRTLYRSSLKLSQSAKANMKR